MRASRSPPSTRSLPEDMAARIHNITGINDFPPAQGFGLTDKAVIPVRYDLTTNTLVDMRPAPPRKHAPLELPSNEEGLPYSDGALPSPEPHAAIGHELPMPEPQPGPGDQAQPVTNEVRSQSQILLGLILPLWTVPGLAEPPEEAFPPNAFPTARNRLATALQTPCSLLASQGPPPPPKKSMCTSAQPATPGGSEPVAGVQHFPDHLPNTGTTARAAGAGGHDRNLRRAQCPGARAVPRPPSEGVSVRCGARAVRSPRLQRTACPTNAWCSGRIDLAPKLIRYGV